MGGVEIEGRLGGDQEDVVGSDVHHGHLDGLLAGVVPPAASVLGEGGVLTLLPLVFSVGSQQRPHILPRETQCWG